MLLRWPEVPEIAFGAFLNWVLDWWAAARLLVAFRSCFCLHDTQLATWTLTVIAVAANVSQGIFDYTNLDSDSVNALEMPACKRVHDKPSCTRLHNYTIVYTNVVAVTKFIAKNNKKHLKNVGPIRHCEPSHAACFTLPFTRCASMSTTTSTTTTRDRGDRYGSVEWAQ